MATRTRLRARVISHALSQLVKESDNVVIMGDKSAEMDSLEEGMGVLNIVKCNDVDGYIIFNHDDLNTGIYRIVEAMKEDEDLWSHFIESEEAEEIITERSLIVVVDTHKPSMVSNARILNRTDYKVVIDHHRRGEDFIENPTLVYMEPYASSTAELVTELLEYQPQNLPLKMIEATALLAGIIVDTKSFTLRTGSRTFDAASYLRSKGADTILVQRFMKEDLDIYVKRSKLIERAEIYHEKVAISKAHQREIFDQVLIAQAADTLLTMTGVNASFVISERNDGQIGISARSLGEINVQVIMEKLNGGGHLTNAATQLDHVTTDEAETLLKNNLAEEATPGNLRALKAQQQKSEQAAQKEKVEAEQLKKTLAELTIELKAKAGDRGRLFGSITNKQIAEVLKKDYGHKVDRRKIELDQPIRALGQVTVPVKLHPEVTGSIKVHVTEK